MNSVRMPLNQRVPHDDESAEKEELGQLRGKLVTDPNIAGVRKCKRGRIANNRWNDFQVG